MRRLQIVGPSVLLVLVSALLYMGAVNHSRLAGENELIWKHPGVSQGDIGTALEGRWQDGGYRIQVRPVPTLIHTLEHSLFDFNRGSYQFVQIILHGLAGVLVFLLLSQWLGSYFLGALGGLLFVSHPTASHSVLYLGGMSEIVCTILFCATLLMMGRMREGRTIPGGMALIALLALLTMLSKEVGFLLPLVAGGWVLAMRVERRTGWKAYVAVLVATLLALLVRLLVIGSTPELLQRIPAVDPTTGLAIIPLLFQSLAGITVETVVMLFPMRLSHDYSWLLLLTGTPLYVVLLLSALLMIGITWVARYRGGTPTRQGLALLAALPLLAPALIPHLQGTVASERNLYLALPGWIGLFLLLGGWITTRRVGLRPVLVGLALLVVVLLGVRTSIRVQDFESQEGLIEAGLKSYPNNPQVLFEQGNLRLTRFDYQAAVESYQAALTLRSDFPLAAVNIGAAYIGLEEWGLALRSLDLIAARAKHVKQLRMVDAKAHYHAGLALLQQRRDREAALAFERMLLFYPDHRGALGNLGLMYIGAPEYVERGMEILERVIEREPSADRRALLRQKMDRAQSLLDGFVDEMGAPPSEIDPDRIGAIGRPWEDVAEEGM